MNGEHGANATRTIAPDRAVVVSRDGGLRRRQDGVFVLADRVWRQTAVFFGDAHRTPGRVKTQAYLSRRRDLRRQQVAGAGGVNVQVVRGSRAPAQRQLGQANEGGEVHGLLVEPCPVRVQGTKPIEKTRAGGGGKSAREVLEDVVVGVDQTRRDQAAVGSEGTAGRRFAPGWPNSDDEAVIDRHPTASHFLAQVHRGHKLRPGDDQVDGPDSDGIGLGHFGESSCAGNRKSDPPVDPGRFVDGWVTSAHGRRKGRGVVRRQSRSRRPQRRDAALSTPQAQDAGAKGLGPIEVAAAKPVAAPLRAPLSAASLRAIQRAAGNRAACEVIKVQRLQHPDFPKDVGEMSDLELLKANRFAHERHFFGKSFSPEDRKAVFSEVRARDLDENSFSDERNNPMARHREFMPTRKDVGVEVAKPTFAVGSAGGGYLAAKDQPTAPGAVGGSAYHASTGGAVGSEVFGGLLLADSALGVWNGLSARQEAEERGDTAGVRLGTRKAKSQGWGVAGGATGVAGGGIKLGAALGSTAVGLASAGAGPPSPLMAGRAGADPRAGRGRPGPPQGGPPAGQQDRPGEQPERKVRGGHDRRASERQGAQSRLARLVPGPVLPG